MTNETPADNRNIAINAQYVKDLSFENPESPASLLINEKPQIDIAVDINGKTLQENSYEVGITISAKAKTEKNTMFVVELSYAGVFTVENIPDNEKEPLLMVYCPNILFPFARRIIADATRDGGFPPLMLDPIDFASLYQQRKMQEHEAAAKANAAN